MTATEDPSELRRRAVATEKPASSSSTPSKKHNANSDDYTITPTDVLRMITGLLVLAGITAYLVTGGDIPRPWWTKPHHLRRLWTRPLELTNEELAAYDGSDPSKPILLALNRTIYDVSSSPHVYGPNGMYSTLAAKDASRSYITTCFDPVQDLVPYLGGVEEIYVPLWLSKNPPPDELDAIATGDVLPGASIEQVIERVKAKVGRRKIKELQSEAYAKARERVRAQIKTWEGMFEKKNYPVVGRVVGVQDHNRRLWRDLKFCDKAKAQRPDLTETLSKAMEALTGSRQFQLSEMKKRKKAAKKAKQGGDAKKKQEEIDEAVSRAVKEAEGGGELDLDTLGLDEDQAVKAQAKIEDMLAGGKFGSQNYDRLGKNKARRDDDDDDE